MQRSFTNRILGGVCGGLAAALRWNVWFIRLAFVGLALPSDGLMVALYVGFWWVLPLESLVEERRGRLWRGLFVVALIIALAGIWAAQFTGQLVSPDGEPLLLPVVAVLLSGLLLWRQVGG